MSSDGGNEGFRSRSTLFRRAWTVTFLSFLVVGVVWIFAQPVFSGADEPEHATESQAVWSGQFLPPLSLRFGTQIESGVVRVPELSNGAGCFFNQAGKSAKCDTKSMHGPTPTRSAPSYITGEPPLPALLTGLPLYLSPHRTGFYLSRLLTSILGAALLATALALAVSRRRPLLAASVLVAATPAVIAEFGVLGSSQLEIGSVIVLWVCVALVSTGEELTRGLTSLLFGSAIVLLLSRPISFGYALLAIAVLVGCCGSVRLRELTTSPGAKAWMVGLGVVFVGSLLWYFLAEAPINPNYMAQQHLPVITNVGKRISMSLGVVTYWWSQMIGATGNDEYLGPAWVTIVWTLMAGAFVGAGLLFGRPRQLVAIAGLAATLLVLPVLGQAYYLPKIYFYWMGRYSLPIFAGLVIVSAAAIGNRLTGRETKRLLFVVVPVVAVLQVVELFSTLRRYVVGINGPINPLHWGSGWHPPIDSLLLLLLGSALIVLAYGAVYWAVLQGTIGRTYDIQQEESPGQVTTPSATSVSQFGLRSSL
jgi:Predicted membrane protein (DUF2142)